MKNKHLILAVTGLLVLFAAVLFFSISLSKDSDDETIYTALAAKIQSAGLKAYNLQDISIDSSGKFWKLSREENGNLLALLAKSGVTYYDTPLYFNPPLFPVALFISHEVLNRSTHFLVLKRDQAVEFHFEQLYAALPNALFSVLFLLGVFLLGKKYFDGKIGLLGALFCLVSPVFLVATFKVWSDLMAATLVLWSFLCWQGRGRPVFRTVVSGALFGLAVLTRTSSLFAVFIFFTKEWKRFSFWALAVFLLIAPWFWAVWRQYGNPFYFPEAASARESLPWLKSISRSWYFYILDLLYLSPIFLAAVFAMRKNTWIFILWIFSFITPLAVLLYTRRPLGLEDRYLLPCYPALAVLAAKSVTELQGFLPKRVLVLIISAMSVWSLRIATLLILSRESLKFVPW